MPQISWRTTVAHHPTEDTACRLGEQLVLVYTPTYDPDANRIEWLWRALRSTVTHTHQRQRLADLVAEADRWARTITPAQVLSQIGSPFAPDQQPAGREDLNHAAWIPRKHLDGRRVDA